LHSVKKDIEESNVFEENGGGYGKPSNINISYLAGGSHSSRSTKLKANFLKLAKTLGNN
jgi:hypothetical protein